MGYTASHVGCQFCLGEFLDTSSNSRGKVPSWHWQPYSQEEPLTIALCNAVQFIFFLGRKHGEQETALTLALPFKGEDTLPPWRN